MQSWSIILEQELLGFEMLNKILNYNFLLRAISGIILLSIVTYGIYGPFSFFALVLLLILYGMMKEWYEITRNNKKDIIMGFVPITIAIFSLLIVKFFKDSDHMLLWYVFAIGSFDTFAMIGGKLIGGKKLAEKISPMKTWSGLFSGVCGSMLISALLSEIFDLKSFEHFRMFADGVVIPTFLICISATAGDLYESYFKRKYGIKDSGNIIPGHGGVLDRFDSIIFSAPIFLIMLII